jgi:hypothetical protein
LKEESLREILEKVRSGECPVEEALSLLRRLPFTDLGFAKVDHHRELRKGLPEVVYCQDKPLDTIRPIVESLLAGNTGNILLTRAAEEVYREVKKVFPAAEYHPRSRLVVIRREEREKIGKVALVTGGTADIPVAEEAGVTAELGGNLVERHFDVGVAGVHRFLSRLSLLQDANVVVVVAGMEGALASIVGGLVQCPIIAVPTSVGYGANLGGISALLTMLNSCAPGVAVVNIDNGFGAGYLAHLINQAAEKK